VDPYFRNRIRAVCGPKSRGAEHTLQPRPAKQHILKYVFLRFAAAGFFRTARFQPANSEPYPQVKYIQIH
jgi:hypothetical protein